MDQGNREAPGEIARTPCVNTPSPLRGEGQDEGVKEYGFVPRRPIILSIVIALASLLFTLTSCLPAVPGDLTDNEKLWQSQGLSNYDFVLERECFCPEDWRGPVRIEVRGGKAVSMTYVTSKQPATEEKFGSVNTINKLFAIIRDAYSGRNTFEKKADTVNATYHAQKGYPLTIYIDVSATIADEEQGYTVEELVVR